MKDLLEASTGPNKPFDPEKAAREHPELFNDEMVLREAITALRTAELSASKARGDRRLMYAKARAGLEAMLIKQD